MRIVGMWTPFLFLAQDLLNIWTGPALEAASSIIIQVSSTNHFIFCEHHTKNINHYSNSSSHISQIKNISVTW